jgi:hypothetical protein
MQDDGCGRYCLIRGRLFFGTQWITAAENAILPFMVGRKNRHFQIHILASEDWLRGL